MRLDRRFTGIIVCFLLFAAALGVRLVWLQLLQHDELATIADRQKVRTAELLQYPRGAILDRHGSAITNGEQAAALLIIPALVDDAATLAEAAGAIIGVQPELLARKIAGTDSDGTELRYTPFVAKTPLSGSEVTAVAALEANGVFLTSQVSRYQSDLPALHIVGTVARAEGDAQAGGTLSGTSGLEYAYEEVLHGGGGQTLGVIVDQHDRAVNGGQYLIFDEPPSSGGVVQTTLDLEIQRAVEDALGERSGAAVVLDAQSGDVLALASGPKFDPYYLSPPEGDDAYVNKALSAYAAASMFKVFLSAVSIESGIVAQSTPFFCNGAYTLPDGTAVRCWHEPGHGALTFDDAIAHSCNPVFISLALKLGKDRIEQAFAAWELDRDDLIGYPLSTRSALTIDGGGENAVANVALGEQGVRLTVLNVAKMLNVIASGGRLLRPRLVTTVTDGGELPAATYPAALPLRVIAPETAAKVTTMMTKTFTQGTGRSLGLSSLDVAGKTGTSETGNVWIGGFLPAAQPRYTIAILIEGGKSGVTDAGPVFKKLCAYLST